MNELAPRLTAICLHAFHSSLHDQCAILEQETCWARACARHGLSERNAPDESS